MAIARANARPTHCVCRRQAARTGPVSATPVPRVLACAMHVLGPQALLRSPEGALAGRLGSKPEAIFQNIRGNLIVRFTPDRSFWYVLASVVVYRSLSKEQNGRVVGTENASLEQTRLFRESAVGQERNIPGLRSCLRCLGRHAPLNRLDNLHFPAAPGKTASEHPTKKTALIMPVWSPISAGRTAPLLSARRWFLSLARRLAFFLQLSRRFPSVSW